jgi:hypothetical protein
MNGPYTTQILGSRGAGRTPPPTGSGASGRPWPFSAALSDPLVEDSGAATLLARLPSGETVRIEVPDGEITIGRAWHNTVVLADPTLSATHAVIRAQGGEYRIIDFGSRNGVFVNDLRISEPHLLASGDVIRMGQCLLTFTLPATEHASVASEPEEEEDPEEKAEGKRAKKAVRMRAAWIAFASRIIAQAIGAATMIFLALLLSGGLPTSCGAVSNKTDTAPPAATRTK